ncbi:hypothetical protein ONZ51_g7991 [Trametes cubensis]|uniref:Uncharacterized protein n=1 Tax=Trametes cubensis TaxID=1111947 RepID=A0AAD7TQB4_9APHY|nr:hypothetical protein ONZ51_g7991 [Trametes cubensis]
MPIMASKIPSGPETSSGCATASIAGATELQSSQPGSLPSVESSAQATASASTSITGHASLSPTHDSSTPTRLSTRPVATIGLAASGAVLFILAIILFFSLRRLKRIRASAKSSNVQKQEDEPSPSSTETPSSTQNTLEDGMKRPGTPWKAPIEWEVATRSQPQDILGSNRAMTPNPQGASLEPSSEERPLLRHSAASSSLVGSSMSEELEHGGSIPTLERHFALTTRPLRGSWGSGGDTVASDVDEPPVAETYDGCLRLSRAYQPSPSSYSTELVRHRDVASHTYELEVTGTAV